MCFFIFYLGTSLSLMGHLCILCYVDYSRRCSTMWNNQDQVNMNSSSCRRNNCDCDDCRRRRCDCDDCHRDRCDCHNHDCHCRCRCCCHRRKSNCGCMNPCLGVDMVMFEMMMKNMMNNNNKNNNKD